MAAPTIDHRGPEFAELGHEVLRGLKTVFQTESPVVIYPASGSGAWEASLVNTLSPGDAVLAFDIGEFSKNWAEVARRLGLDVELMPGTWRRGVDPDEVGERLARDRDHRIKALLVVHNETSTGVTSRLPEIRHAIDLARHPALLLVDAVSSLGSIDLRHDEWGLDVTLAGSQKGLMLPPGLSFNAISAKALAASKEARLPRAYWAWDAMLAANVNGFFPTTPSTNLLFGLREALRMLVEEGLPGVFIRHRRLAEAARAAVRGWNLEMLCERDDEYSPVVTTVVMPGAPAVTTPIGSAQIVLDRFNMSLGAGLGRLKGRTFRIGHLGDFNELMLIGTLGGVELGLGAAGVPFSRGGVDAALALLAHGATVEPAAGRQRPVKVGGRFDRNAETPSRKVSAGIAVRDEVSESPASCRP